MKKLIFLNEIMILTIFSAGILFFASCNQNQRSDDTKDLAEERNEAKFNQDAQQEDAQFLVNASEINLKQIRLGRLAQQRGRTNDVVELGKRMEDSHTKAQRDLQSLAQRKNISIPTSQTHDSRDAYEDLNDESDSDFDEAYANRMVSANEDAISTYENASSDSHDRDIQNWARSQLQNLRTQLDHAKDCQRKFADAYFEDNRDRDNSNRDRDNRNR